MSNIVQLVKQFWNWSGNPEKWSDHAISSFNFDPLAFPNFHEMQTCCINLINKELTLEELDAFLTCMALDEEDEEILDSCKHLGNESFTVSLVARGIQHKMREARWQMAELLRKNIPGQQVYLDMLVHDKDPYVQKRAQNVLSQLAGCQGDGSAGT